MSNVCSTFANNYEECSTTNIQLNTPVSAGCPILPIVSSQVVNIILTAAKQFCSFTIGN